MGTVRGLLIQDVPHTVKVHEDVVVATVARRVHGSVIIEVRGDQRMHAHAIEPRCPNHVDARVLVNVVHKG